MAYGRVEFSWRLVSLSSFLERAGEMGRDKLPSTQTKVAPPHVGFLPGRALLPGLLL